LTNLYIHNNILKEKRGIMSIVLTGKGGMRQVHCDACEKNCGNVEAKHGLFVEDNVITGMGFSPIECDKYVKTHTLDKEIFNKIARNLISEHKFRLEESEIIDCTEQS
jgi:hypothetical protein